MIEFSNNLPTKTISKSVYEDGIFGLLGPPPDDLDWVYTNNLDVALDLLMTLLIDFDIIFILNIKLFI